MNKLLKKIIALTIPTLLISSLISCGGSSKSKDESSESSSSLTAIDAYGELDPQVSAQQIIADKIIIFSSVFFNFVVIYS